MNSKAQTSPQRFWFSKSCALLLTLLCPVSHWWKVNGQVLFSRVWLFVILWTVASQAPLSMEFPKQEYWSGLPFPSPGALSDPGIKLMSPAWQVDSLPLSHLGCPFIGRGPVLGNLCTHCMVTSAGRLQHVAWCLLHSRWFLSGKKEARGSCVFSPGCESSLIPWRRSLAVTMMFYDQFFTYPMRC